MKINNRHKLIICADDFGLSPGVNEAIIDLAQKQKIQALIDDLPKKDGQRLLLQEKIDK